jgi:hypothetical protein
MKIEEITEEINIELELIEGGNFERTLSIKQRCIRERTDCTGENCSRFLHGSIL